MPTPDLTQRRRRPVYGDWWRRRHHCSDGVVLGSNHRVSSEVDANTTTSDTASTPATPVRDTKGA